MRRLAIFGATGTIGDNALDLVARHSDRFSVSVMTAHSNAEKLAALARLHKPQVLVIGDEAGRATLRDALPDFDGEIWVGPEGLRNAAEISVDVALHGIVGFAGLEPALVSAAQGGVLALANKEALVAAGPILMKIAAKNGSKILPVDSEHNAIYQLLDDGQVDRSVDKIILTASGGPFRDFSTQQMVGVTPQQAVAHPNWDMGAKISVDSATLMNKGLELIEARHLFDVSPELLDVLVHPQSIVHGLVYFNDGSVLAQKGSPDMRVPLAYCMAHPERIETGVERLDLAAQGRLDFEAADRERFPCLALAEAAMHAGGAAPTILNAANEAAVAAFLDEVIGFTDIGDIVDAVLQRSESGAADDLPSIFQTDEKARQSAQEFVQKLAKN